MKSGKRRSEPPAFVAYHEAGHAVVADYFGKLEWVRLWPEPAAAVSDCDESVYGSILYAGSLAQCRYQRRGLAGVFLSTGASDLKKLRELIDRTAHVRPPENLWRSFHWGAACVLSCRWPAVQAVAAALLERGRLTADEVRGIVGGPGTDLIRLAPRAGG